MKNIWFTSDTHYSHANITGSKVSIWKNGYRNFDSIEEMNNTLINNINKCVGENDILYHLGDWSFSGVQNILYFRRSLVCKNINLILGNHDKHIIDKEIIIDGESFNMIKLFSSVNSVFSGNIDKKYFHLSHYAHRVWPNSQTGSIHLYGHSHGTLPGIGKSMDVGIDCHPEFRPFNVDEILEIMNKNE